MVLSFGLSEPFLKLVRIVVPNAPLLSVRSIQRWDATSNWRSFALGRSMVPIPQLYVAFSLDALNGMTALRLADRSFQSIALSNSTRFPASPAARLTV